MGSVAAGKSPPSADSSVFMVANEDGILYVVATPIGNLADVGRRALEVLANVDLIAAEDTRKTAVLLREYGIQTPMQAYHEHNEDQEASRLAQAVAMGSRVALVSDAGTPLVSDPGFRLVSEARRRRLRVVPIPGPSALIAALSASGLPSDRFLFAGFPPRGEDKRLTWLRGLANEPGTIILYESSHRIRDTMTALCELFGNRRQVVLARELTKIHETFLSADACALAEALASDLNQSKGEHVVMVQGAGQKRSIDEDESERLLAILLEELPVKLAAALAARITGGRKNELYKLALRISRE